MVGVDAEGPPALEVRGYYPRKFFEILNAKSCNLVHVLSYDSYAANVSIIVPAITALVRVTHFVFAIFSPPQFAIFYFPQLFPGSILLPPVNGVDAPGRR